MHDRPHAAARSNYASHNSTVTADGQADTCQCGTCRAFAAGQVPGLALDNRGPSALAGMTVRGPMQDESGTLDPVDAAAMRFVEGGR